LAELKQRTLDKVYRRLLSQRFMVGIDTEKVIATSSLGLPASTAASTLTLRAFEYGFMLGANTWIKTYGCRCEVNNPAVVGDQARLMQEAHNATFTHTVQPRQHLFYPGTIGVLSLLAAYIVTNVGALWFLFLSRRVRTWEAIFPLVALVLLGCT